MRLFPGFTLVLFLSGFPAAGAEPRYAIGRVAVTGGHPVREIARGVVFVQDFNKDCGLNPAGSAGPAFAGSISSEVGITIDVVSCPRSAPDPEVRCHWRLAPKPPADPIFSKPYEPTAEVPQAPKAGEPQEPQQGRRRPRQVAALLGGLKRA